MEIEKPIDEENEVEALEQKPEDLLAAGRFEEAAEAFAKKGDPESFFAAAKIYQNNLHQPEKANPLYVKAAEGGVQKAFNPSAIAFKNGEGVEKDLAKAEEFIRKGADLGDFVSTYNYASWLQNGDLGRIDEDAALAAYRKAKECAGYARAPEKVRNRIEESIVRLDGGLTNEPDGFAAKKKQESEGKGWILGFYGVLIVLGIAGCVLSAFAAKQLENAGWYGLWALFGLMIVSNVTAIAWKKLRYNNIHFYSDLVLALAYIVVIVVCAVMWYQAKGLGK